MSNTIIPCELQENDYYITITAEDLAKDDSLEAKPYINKIKETIQKYNNGEIDTYTALNQIHHELVYYDYHVVIPREERGKQSCIIIFNPDDDLERFIKENFYEGLVFPNKKAIYNTIGLNLLGIKNLNGGKQKRIAESKVKQHMDIQPVEKSKRQQEIIEIYDVPHYIAKEDMRGKRGKFRDKLIPISINWLLQVISDNRSKENYNETIIYTTVNQLAYEFGLISSEYQSISNERLEEIDPLLKPYVVSQFYYISKPQIKGKIFDTLDVLQDDYRVLTYYRNYLITTNDNKTFISDKTHDNIIRKAERTIIKEMGYSSLPFIFKAKKENEFYKRVIQFINTNYHKNWKRYRQQIELHIDNDELREVNNQFEPMTDLEVKHIKSLLANIFGDQLYRLIESQVKSRNKKAIEEEKALINTFPQNIQDCLDCGALNINDIYRLYNDENGKNKIKPFSYPDYFMLATQKLLIIMLP